MDRSRSAQSSYVSVCVCVFGDSGAKGPADGGIGSSCAWGALAYLAPEVPERGPSKKSDVWSYGCVLYHMCTGRQPFQVCARVCGRLGAPGVISMEHAGAHVRVCVCGGGGGTTGRRA